MPGEHGAQAFCFADGTVMADDVRRRIRGVSKAPASECEKSKGYREFLVAGFWRGLANRVANRENAPALLMWVGIGRREPLIPLLFFALLRSVI